MILRIQAIRKEKGMTQEDLSKKIGISRNALSQWETETSLPKTRQLPALASALGVQIGDLFCCS